MELALRDTRAFLERVEAVPSTQRERWIGELSRFAAESGSATSVAERLRATDDPRAWQMATHFDVASFDAALTRALLRRPGDSLRRRAAVHDERSSQR